MGSGKTTVGRLLAGLSGYDFIDIDELISERAGKRVADIFADHGEDEFREMERDAVASLRGLTRTVVALGGGTYTFAENRERIGLIGKAVWLDCPLDLCLLRIAHDGSRPLLSDAESMRALYEHRRRFYAMADYSFDAGGESPEQIASAIASKLRRDGLLD